MKHSINRIQKAFNDYETIRDNFVKEIQSDIDFECDIIHQSGDGLCILNIEDATVCALDFCIAVINKNGRLTISDFNENSI